MRRRRSSAFASFEPRQRSASAAAGLGHSSLAARPASSGAAPRHSSLAARPASSGAAPRYAIPAVREVLRRTAEPQSFASVW